MSFKEKSTELIQYVLSGGKAMEILPIWVLDHGRLNEKRPAYIKIAVPDAYVVNIKGDQPQDVYLMIKVPHEVHEKWINWSSQPSGIKGATGIQLEQTWNKEPEVCVFNIVDESGEPSQPNTI